MLTDMRDEFDSASDYPGWAYRQIEAGKSDGAARMVATIPGSVMEKSHQIGHAPLSAEIMLTAAALRHLTRDVKQQAGKAISRCDLLRLPEHLQAPQAVLLAKRTGELLFVFEPVNQKESRRGKAVVRLRQRMRLRDVEREKRMTNLIVTAGLVGATALRDRNEYELMEGTWPIDEP